MIINRTHYSLLESVNQIEDLVQNAKEKGLKFLSINDYCSISGCVSFYNECIDNGIKPLLGTDFLIDGSWLTVIAKSYKGWQDLIRLTSKANSQACRRLCGYHQSYWEDFSGGHDWIVITGHDKSVLYNAIITNGQLDPGFQKKGRLCLDKIRKHISADIYLGIHTNTSFYAKFKQFGLQIVPISDAHYLDKNKDAVEDHQVVLATKEKCEISQLQNTKYLRFMNSSEFFLPTHEDLINRKFSEPEIANMQSIADKCESFTITNSYKLPSFECPNKATPDAYLDEICQEGLINKNLADKPEYVERLSYELNLLQTAKLSAYFLIVRDITKFLTDRDKLVNVRGSAAGCLVSYLIGITTVDPLKYDLLFERFWNPDKASLPDIDVDVPRHSREDVIRYINEKYGVDCVGNIITFLTMGGRAAIKNVFRAHGKASFDLINKMTKLIKDKAKISDKMQAEDEDSVLRYALKHNPDYFVDWCAYDKKTKEITGEYAHEFKQAIRLEGIKSAPSKHAAGIIVGDGPLDSQCPMVEDHDGNQIVGWEFEDAEKTGLMKVDILGLVTLDKIMDVLKDIDTHNLEPVCETITT